MDWNNIVQSLGFWCIVVPIAALGGLAALWVVEKIIRPN